MIQSQLHCWLSISWHGAMNQVFQVRIHFAVIRCREAWEVECSVMLVGVRNWKM